MNNSQNRKCNYLKKYLYDKKFQYSLLLGMCLLVNLRQYRRNLIMLMRNIM